MMSNKVSGWWWVVMLLPMMGPIDATGSAQDQPKLPTFRGELVFQDGHPGTYLFPSTGDVLNIDFNHMDKIILRLARPKHLFGSIYLGQEEAFRLIHIEQDEGEKLMSFVFRAAGGRDNHYVELEFQRHHFSRKTTVYLRRVENHLTKYLAVFREVDQRSQPEASK